jgi:phenylacetate 2-hydroxylase
MVSSPAYFLNIGIKNKADTDCYGADAFEFRPERWLSTAKPDLTTLNPPHFAYGAGSRLCPAMNISNRIIYALLIRLILEFRIVADGDNKPNVDPIEFSAGAGEFVKSPGDFKVRFLERNESVGRPSLAVRLGEEQRELESELRVRTRVSKK